MREIHMTLSYDDCLLLLAAIDSYQYDLDNRYKRSSNLFHAYGLERQKQISEDNRSRLLVRMYHLDMLKQVLLSSMPVSDLNSSV